MAIYLSNVLGGGYVSGFSGYSGVGHSGYSGVGNSGYSGTPGPTVYPGVGIPLSTGSSWDTSISTGSSGDLLVSNGVGSAAFGKVLTGAYSINESVGSSALTLTGATQTSSYPVINATQTWNNAATTFTGIKFNVTNTASAAASTLMDLQIGGSSQFSYSQATGIFIKTTSATGVGLTITGPDNVAAVITGNSLFRSGSISLGQDIGASVLGIYSFLAFSSYNGFRSTSAGIISWSSSTNPAAINSATDLIILRDSANILAQRNSTNAQTYRLYNTYTDASNYERLGFNWSGNTATIATEAAGTGTARNLSLTSSGGTLTLNADITNIVSTGNGAASLYIKNANGTSNLYLANLKSNQSGNVYFQDVNNNNSFINVFNNTTSHKLMFSAYNSGQIILNTNTLFLGDHLGGKINSIYFNNIFNNINTTPTEATINGGYGNTSWSTDLNGGNLSLAGGMGIGTGTGGLIRFWTASGPAASNTLQTLVERMNIDSTGKVSVLTSTDSSSTTTGALVVSGGIGTGGSINVGGTINTTQTWNSSGTTFTAVKANITDTASASGSLLMDLQVGGTTKFNVDKSGNATLTNQLTLASNQLRIWNNGTAGRSQFRSISNNYDVLELMASLSGSNSPTQNQHIGVRGGGGIAWAVDAIGINTTYDLALFKDSAYILAQRWGTNGQTYRLYGTYTDASNYERGYFTTDNNGLTIGHEALGTGTQRSLNFALGTVTTSTPLNITQTWNNASTIFTAIKANITDTASSVSAILMDLQVGGTSKFYVDKTGSIYTYYGLNISGGPLFTSGSTYLTGNNVVSWGTSNRVVIDLAILKDASNTLGQRNGANAQTYRLYGTYTDSGNYERAYFTADSSGLTIGHQAAGTGIPRSVNVALPGTSIDTPLNITQTWNAAAIATTGTSGTGTTATITFAAQTYAYPVGSTVVVAGITPTGYNGTYTVTASTTTSVSYASTTTGSQTVAGTVQQLFTAIKENITDTASASSSLLMDLQVGGTTKFNIRKDGAIRVPVLTGVNTSIGISNNLGVRFESDRVVISAVIGDVMLIRTGGTPGTAGVNISAGYYLSWNFDSTITRRGSANLQLGSADAAAPVAQTLTVQGVVAGTSNTAGQNFTIQGSAGTGTGAGGDIVLQVAPAGSSGSTQNTYADALRIYNNKTVAIAAGFTVATLPAAGTVGRIARVTDGDAALAWGATIINSGSGSTPYLVWDNGTNWTVFGK